MNSSPAVYVLLSSAAAGAALALTLWSTQPGAFDDHVPERAFRLTPERAAENFIEAYLAEDFVQAATFAAEPFARAVRSRPKRASQQQRAANNLRWLLQESHVLRADKLRFVGVLVGPGEDESSGWPVTLTLVRNAGARYRVESLHWPKGPPPELPSELP